MITEKIQETQKLMEDGHSAAWSAGKIAARMTDNEIEAFANEEGSRRFISSAQRAVTGMNTRTGETYNDFEKANMRNQIVTMISDLIYANITR